MQDLLSPTWEQVQQASGPMYGEQTPHHPQTPPLDLPQSFVLGLSLMFRNACLLLLRAKALFTNYISII